MRRVAEGLEVHPERMRENLEATRGLVMAERVALLLADRLGREEAHDLLRAASARLGEGSPTLRDALLADDRVRGALSEDELDAALEPASYLGSAGALVDRALGAHRSS
jgi:3-carboxy-cis,cis-muconate cycloisomerase